jgi:hypothetical protein
MKMEIFENKVSTFTSDNFGNDDEGVNQTIFNPFFGVPISSRKIMKLRLENFVVAWSWKLVVLEPVISNPWQLCG